MNDERNSGAGLQTSTAGGCGSPVNDLEGQCQQQTTPDLSAVGVNSHQPYQHDTPDDVVSSVTPDSQQEAENIICPVCMEIPDTTSTVRTPCGHIYCDSCIAHWLEQNPCCPSCRANCSYGDVIPLNAPTEPVLNIDARRHRVRDVVRFHQALKELLESQLSHLASKKQQYHQQQEGWPPGSGFWRFFERLCEQVEREQAPLLARIAEEDGLLDQTLHTSWCAWQEAETVLRQRSPDWVWFASAS